MKAHIAGAAVGLLVSLGWLIYGIATVGQHGVTLDEPSLFYAGDRTLFFLTHPTVPGALDFPAPGEPAGFHPRFPRFPDFADPWHYPVLPHLVMAISNQVFHVWLGWVDDIDGHHLGIVFLHAVGLFAFAFFACRLLGLRAGACAAVAYALYPTLVGFAFNNPKDVPVSDFYSAGVLAAASGFLHRRPKDLWASAVIIGIALSSKINGALAIALIWLCLLIARPRVADLKASGLWRPLLWLPVIASALFFVLWPWMWHGTPVDWVKHLIEYFRFCSTFAHSARPTFTIFPFKATAAMTPPLVLFATFAGLIRIFRKESALRPIRWLLVIWVFLPLGRIALPYSEFYDANRHFIEYIGGLCVLAGIGFDWALDALSRLRFGRALEGVLGAAAALLLCRPVAEYRPFEGAYINSFFGGLGGAQQNALFFMLSLPHDSRASGSEGDFWASSLRGALAIASDIIPPGKRLGVCGAGAVNIQSNLIGRPSFGFTRVEDPNADYLYFMPRECYCKWADIRRAETERPVVVRVERGGGLIYEILGPKVPYELPPISAHSRYEILPHYRGRRSPLKARRGAAREPAPSRAPSARRIAPAPKAPAPSH